MMDEDTEKARQLCFRILDMLSAEANDAITSNVIFALFTTLLESSNDRVQTLGALTGMAAELCGLHPIDFIGQITTRLVAILVRDGDERAIAVQNAAAQTRQRIMQTEQGERHHAHRINHRLQHRRRR